MEQYTLDLGIDLDESIDRQTDRQTGSFISRQNPEIAKSVKVGGGYE